MRGRRQADQLKVIDGKLVTVPAATLSMSGGKLTTSLKAPGQTVLWSYGPRKHLSYAFQGKALIAYADGHVKLLNKAEVTKLRWKP